MYRDYFTSTYHCNYWGKELWWFDLQELQTQDVISYIAKNALFKLDKNIILFSFHYHHSWYVY
jgi:hypothetical protein